MNLKSCIDTLKFTKEPGTQLDLFRENGQVIIQIYKQRDVLTWGLEIYLDDPDGLVLEILFNKAKKNNNENYARFIKSELFNHFAKINSIKEDSYFAVISSSWSTDKILNFVNEVVTYIYDLNNSEIKYSLNAY